MQKSLPSQNREQTKNDDDVHQGEVVPFEVFQPEDRTEAQKHLIAGFAVVKSHVGPLPAPRDFAQYEQAVTGAGMRIIGMAETEQAHRHKQEHRVTTADIGLQYLGPILTVGLAAFGLWLGSSLILAGHEKSGIAVIVTALTGILSSVIRSTVLSRIAKSQLTLESTNNEATNGKRKPTPKGRSKKR